MSSKVSEFVRGRWSDYPLLHKSIANLLYPACMRGFYTLVLIPIEGKRTGCLLQESYNLQYQGPSDSGQFRSKSRPESLLDVGRSLN